MTTTAAKIRIPHHRIPSVGDYIAAGGSLYRVAAIGDRVQIEDRPGPANYLWGEVEPADWGDCPEGAEFPAELDFAV